MKGYCVRCRKMMDMVAAKKVRMKNKRYAMKGKCGKCGTKLFKFVGG